MRSKQKKSGIYIIMAGLSLTPILIWPLILFANVFLFDAPGSSENLRVWLKFIGISAYPLYLGLNLGLSIWLYRKIKWLSYALLLWPIIGLALFVVWISN